MRCNASHPTPPLSVPKDCEAPILVLERILVCAQRKKREREREREKVSKSITDFPSHQLVSRFEPMSTDLEFRSCK